MDGDQDLFRESEGKERNEETPSSETDNTRSAEETQKVRIDNLEASVVEDLDEYQLEPFTEEQAKEMDRAFEKAQQDMDAKIRSIFTDTFAEVLAVMGRKEYEKALGMIEDFVGHAEEGVTFHDDSRHVYRCLDETFEHILYCHYFQPAREEYIFQPPREVHPISFKYHTMYYLYGNILFELGRLEDAREALLKGLHWNPVDFSLMSEYTETFKSAIDLETFYGLTLEMGKIAFRPKDLARYYRNLGFYFIEKELYQEAEICYILCLRQEPESETAYHELEYICQKSGKVPEIPSQETIKEVCRRCNIPERGDETLLKLAYDNGKYCLETKNYAFASYFLGILYGLTKAPDIKEMLDSIPSEEDAGGESEGEV